MRLLQRDFNCKGGGLGFGWLLGFPFAYSGDRTLSAAAAAGEEEK